MNPLGLPGALVEDVSTGSRVSVKLFRVSPEVQTQNQKGYYLFIFYLPCTSSLRSLEQNPSPCRVGFLGESHQVVKCLWVRFL